MFAHGSLEDDGSFEFFMCQALAIMIEDHVIDVGKSFGLKDSRFWRLCGFVWTILALGAGTQRYSSKTITSGMWVHDRVPDWFGLGP